MRVGGRLTEQHDADIRGCVGSELQVRAADEVGHFSRRDPFAQDARGRLVHFQRQRHGVPDQRDFRRRLDHAAGRRDRRAVDEAVGVAGPAQAVEGEERRRRIDRNGAARIAEVAHDIDHQRGRALVLLPAADLAGDAHHRMQPLGFEGGADIDGGALRRDHDAVQAFRELEAQAGEIEAAGRGIEVQRRDAFATHDRLRLGDARAQLVVADARDTLAHRAHPAELRLDGRAADAESHGPVLSPSSSSGTSSAASTRPGSIIPEVKCPAWCDRFIVPSTRP